MVKQVGIFLVVLVENVPRNQKKNRNCGTEKITQATYPTNHCYNCNYSSGEQTFIFSAQSAYISLLLQKFRVKSITTFCSAI
jgi:hypothetical protein